MSFFMDDPLEDLLSDNDSFDNSKKKPKAATGKSTRKSDGLESYGYTPHVTKPVPSKNGETEIGDDIEHVDLGFDPKKPKAGIKSAKIFDDILGPMPRPENQRPATAKPTLSRQSTAHSDSTVRTQTQVRPRTSIGRRTSGRSMGMNSDQLDLFPESKKEKEAHAAASGSAVSKPAKKRGTTADWLGLSLTSEQNTGAIAKVVAEPEIPKTTKALVHRENIEDEEEPANVDMSKALTEMVRQDSSGDHIAPGEPLFKLPQIVISSDPAQNIMLLNTMNAQVQNSCNKLQQQELQLTLATQMKQQEHALVGMHRKQEAVLQEQEGKFSTLLQEQVHRQQKLEENIKLQQQRISNHIQLLMTQPASVGLPYLASETEVGAESIVGGGPRPKTPQHQQQVVSLETVHLEADVKRLELEKVRLEELVDNIKINYDKEMDMIESSFRKQLKILEEHLTSVETRLKSEINELQSFYANKLEARAEDKEKLKAEYEARMTTIKQDHDDELRRLRKSQEDDLNMLKEEHRRMLDTIRQAKALEFATVQENGSYLETLKAASNNLSNVSGGLEMLRDEMQLKIETINRERERTLDLREQRLEDREKRLQISEERAEEEKGRLMELVSTLQLQLDMRTKESEEENWLLRQQMASLDAERAAFERERIMLRDQFARDEKRIDELKAQQIAQTKRHLQKLNEEQYRLNMDRAKFDVERRLQQPCDFEKQRLEATLHMAQNALRKADVERMRCHHMQRELEQRKRDLVENDNILAAKIEEVAMELQSMRAAEQKSLEMQHQAHSTEKDFKAKIKLVQKRMRELAEKEAQLSEEQLSLAQERIRLQNLNKHIGQQKCALCQMSKRNTETAEMVYKNETNMRSGADGEEEEMRRDVASGGGGGDDGKYRNIMNRGNVVERILDDNIVVSYRRMRQSMVDPDFYTESALDDDSKELALHNLDLDFHLKNTDG